MNVTLPVLHLLENFAQQLIVFLLLGKKFGDPFVAHVTDKYQESQTENHGEEGKEEEMVVHGVVFNCC